LRRGVFKTRIKFGKLYSENEWKHNFRGIYGKKYGNGKIKGKMHGLLRYGSKIFRW